MMPAPGPEAIIAATLTLLRDHSDVLHDPRMRRIQLRQLENVGGLIEESTAADGELRLDSATTAVVLSLLTDCLARLRRASEDNPKLTRVRARLGDWQHTLEQLRDRATTLAMRKGPSGQDPRRRKGGNGWNPPDPRG